MQKTKIINDCFVVSYVGSKSFGLDRGSLSKNQGSPIVDGCFLGNELLDTLNLFTHYKSYKLFGTYC
jgi:hypothetical protein